MKYQFVIGAAVMLFHDQWLYRFIQSLTTDSGNPLKLNSNPLFQTRPGDQSLSPYMQRYLKSRDSVGTGGGY